MNRFVDLAPKKWSTVSSRPANACTFAQKRVVRPVQTLFHEIATLIACFVPERKRQQSERRFAIRFIPLTNFSHKAVHRLTAGGAGMLLCRW